MNKKRRYIVHKKYTILFAESAFYKTGHVYFYNSPESGKTLINHRLLSAMFYSPLSAISPSSCAAPSIPARV